MDNYTSYRNIFRIAYPIMLSSLGQNLINLIDTVFLGRVSEVALGAGALGGIFYFVMLMLGFGFNIGMQIIISRRMGEKKEDEIGKVFDHELYLIGVLGITQFILMHFFGRQLLGLLIHSPAVHEATSEFIWYRSYGIFFALLNSCFLQFFIGINKTRVATLTTLVLCVINILLDYLFIFGHYGFPKMGIGGAALASSISEATITVVFLLFLWKRGYIKRFKLFRFPKIENYLMKKMIALSSPIVGQNFISISTWFIFFLFIEQLGEKQLAVSNVIKGLYIFWAIPTWALGATANSMVSNVMGQGRLDKVFFLIRRICSINLIVTSVLCSFLFIFPALALRVFTNDEGIIQAATPIIFTIGIALLIFSVAFIVMLSVSGTGSSKFALYIEVVSISLYLVYTFLTARVFVLGLPVIWGAEVVYWTSTLTLGLLFFKYGNWNKKV